MNSFLNSLLTEYEEQESIHFYTGTTMFYFTLDVEGNYGY